MHFQIKRLSLGLTYLFLYEKGIPGKTFLEEILVEFKLNLLLDVGGLLQQIYLAVL